MTHPEFDIAIVAKICHQANKAYCESNGDSSQLDWENAAAWQRKSACAGVEYAIANPDASPGSQHAAWLADKIKDGWKYGPKKDEKKKEHPSMVPFEQLPVLDQLKDALFLSIVRALVPRKEAEFAAVPR